MSKKISFIGGGNMASAILRGVLKAGLAAEGDIMVSAPSQGSRDRIRENFGVQVTADNQEAARFGQLVILAVKPNILAPVISEIKNAVAEETLMISIAAGKSLRQIESAFGHRLKLVRVMPNTPAMVGEAMSALTANERVSEKEREEVLALFNALGRAEIVPESLMDAVTGISGSAPAYIYMMIEAMADAAVV